MKGRRTQYEIYWEILTFCKNPRSFTSIIHSCNLNSKIAQEYIEFLIKKSYLLKNEENNRMMYLTFKLAGFKETRREGDVAYLEHDRESIDPFPDHVTVNIVGEPTAGME